jgi:hypothetical protein
LQKLSCLQLVVCKGKQLMNHESYVH